MPSAFVAQADASVVVDTDYFTSIELTSTDPQVVTYTINPAATWSDGTPITWRDLQAQWQALNGTNPAFVVSGTTGYEDDRLGRAGRGRQAGGGHLRPAVRRVEGLFGLIYPASTNTDPATFNEGWINKIPVTAGPFQPETIDTTAQTITLVRDDAWWGERAKLDRIIFRVVERQALADALANNEIDWYEIGSDVNLFARAQGIQGAEVRQATAPVYNHLTFNGAEGAILADPALRRAIAQGVDRQAIARALIGQIVPETTPLGNFIFVQGSENYVDHGIAFDPAAANAALDQLGWVSPGPGQVRQRDGRPLTVRYVTTAGNPISDRISQLTQKSLSEIGVGVELVPAASADLFDEFVTPGNFDIVGFGWSGTVFPVTSSRNIYSSSGEQNFGKISSPEIDAMYDQAIRELDDAKRVELGQRIDQGIWGLMPQLPLYQGTGAFAVRTTLANFGAPGFASYDYANIGFVAP